MATCRLCCRADVVSKGSGNGRTCRVNNVVNPERVRPNEVSQGRHARVGVVVLCPVESTTELKCNSTNKMEITITLLVFHLHLSSFALSCPTESQSRGMSGRLIITGKKSFCPWAPKNVERVLRDERIEQEKLKKETAAQRQWDAENQIKKLKQHQPTHTEDEIITDKGMQRFHLFEKEEITSMTQSVTRAGVDKSKVGIMPVFLGGDEIERRKSEQDFYIRKNNVDKGKDDRLKSLMDPMRGFHRHDDFIDGNSSGKRKTLGREESMEDVKINKKMKPSRDGVESSSKSSAEQLKRRLSNRERIEKERESDIYSRKMKGL